MTLCWATRVRTPFAEGERGEPGTQRRWGHHRQIPGNAYPATWAGRTVDLRKTRFWCRDKSISRVVPNHGLVSHAINRDGHTKSPLSDSFTNGQYCPHKGTVQGNPSKVVMAPKYTTKQVPLPFGEGDTCTVPCPFCGWDQPFVLIDAELSVADGQLCYHFWTCYSTDAGKRFVVFRKVDR